RNLAMQRKPVPAGNAGLRRFARAPAGQDRAIGQEQEGVLVAQGFVIGVGDQVKVETESRKLVVTVEPVGLVETGGKLAMDLRHLQLRQQALAKNPVRY